MYFCEACFLHLESLGRGATLQFLPDQLRPYALSVTPAPSVLLRVGHFQEPSLGWIIQLSPVCPELT